MMPKKPQPPEGFQPGDDECRSCTGIAFLTSEMRAKGQKPGCLGFNKVLKQRIPLDQLESLNKQNYVQDLGFYFHIGYSRSSGLMERTGRVPVSVQGLVFHFSRRIIPKARQDEAGTPFSPAAPVPATGTGGDLAPPSDLQLMRGHAEDASLTAEKYYKLAKRAARKQWEGLKKNADWTRKFCISTSKDFPSKMYKTSSKLAASIDKLGRKVYSKATSLWRDF